MIISRALFVVFALIAVTWILRNWYARKIATASEKLRSPWGSPVPGPCPCTLFGNLLDVYRSENRLSAYHDFHRRFGRVIQIFWMWRSQLSIADYRMAARILFSQQKNYQKYLNRLQHLKRLFGSSVLTRQGRKWYSDRQLLSTSFSKQAAPRFHHTFIEYGQTLGLIWSEAIRDAQGALERDVYPDMQALFLDIVGQIALGRDFGALRGELDAFVRSINYILAQSIKPVHAFVHWWHRVPTPARAKSERAFRTVDDYLFDLIHQERVATAKQERKNTLLARLLQSTLKEQMIRDTLVAVIINGHESPATCIALTMALLAKHPHELERLQVELEQALHTSNGELTTLVLDRLHYHDWVLQESLRLYPPVAGLNRRAIDDDIVDGWTIPGGQEIGIALMPLHRDSRYYGVNPAEFCPARFSNGSLPAYRSLRGKELQTPHVCPTQASAASADRNTVYAPMSFGAGTRKCPAEHFALYAMKTVLAIIVRDFEWQLAPGFEPEVEIRKHGLAPTAYPKHGVPLLIRRRSAPSTDEVSAHTNCATQPSSAAPAIPVQHLPEAI